MSKNHIHTNFFGFTQSELDNYASAMGRNKYQDRKTALIDSIKSFNDIDDDKIMEIFEFFGTEGFNDEEDAFKDMKEKIEFYKTLPDPVTLYRIVGVKNRKMINTQDLGEHYTPHVWMLETDLVNDLVNSIGDETWEEGTVLYVLVVESPLCEIDVWQTIIQNLSFPNENEMNLKNKGRGAKFVKAYKM